MHEVQWQGKTLIARNLTVGMKEAFCAFVKRWTCQELVKTMGDAPAALTPALTAVPSQVWWGAGEGNLSKLVADMLVHPAGDLAFNRIVFGDSVKTLSDADLQAMIDAKGKEQAEANTKAKAAGVRPPYPPVNDYFLAMHHLREESDPKAKGPATGAAP